MAGSVPEKNHFVFRSALRVEILRSYDQYLLNEQC
jgi:hypothetical protein